MNLRTLLALILACPPLRAEEQLSPPALEGLIFPSNAAVLSVLGEGGLAQYQSDLAKMTGNPASADFQRRARDVSRTWTRKMYEGAFPDAAERALLESLAKGSPEGMKRLRQAANAGRAQPFIQEWRDKALALARERLIRDPSSAGEKLFAYYCAHEAEQNAPLSPQGARQQAEAIERREAGFDSPAPAPLEQLSQQCSNWRKKQEWKKPASSRYDASGRPVPGPRAGTEKPPSSLASDLKRDAIAGAFGAAAFGLVGFVFGGPAGAALGAAAGFAVLAAVAQLNNHPINIGL